jgi:hypothetical protein
MNDESEMVHRLLVWTRCLHPAGQYLKRAPTWVEVETYERHAIARVVAQPSSFTPY